MPFNMLICLGLFQNTFGIRSLDNYLLGEIALDIPPKRKGPRFFVSDVMHGGNRNQIVSGADANRFLG
jgi:hypothetical protein